MKSQIFVSIDHIVNLLGRDYDRELTFPQIFKDSRYSVYPVLTPRGDKRHLVVGAADAAAHTAAASPVPFTTYGRYFDWNQGSGYVPTAFASAVRSVTGEDELDIEATMPTGRFRRSPPTVRFRSLVPSGNSRSTSTPGRASNSKPSGGNARCRCAAARPFVSSLRFGPELLTAMSAEPLGFDVLDRLAAAAKLGGIFVSAAFDVEMFAGLRQAVAEDFGVTAYYRPCADDIVVLSAKPLDQLGLRALGVEESLSAALAKLAAGVTGFQRDHLPIAVFQRLEARGMQLTDATYCLRRWFDERAGTDLLYFITAANAVLAGVEHAKAFIRRMIGGAISERDLAAVYHQGVADFVAFVGMSGRVMPYFDIIHPGERTLLPAIAGNYPVEPSNKTIKFDMGLLVTDSFGIVRGCSDIARSISFDPNLQAVHDKLRALLVDRLIPSIKPGMSGGEIHRIGVDILRPMSDELKSCGMLHPDMEIEGYTRDCGHTLQRQTLATVHFLPGFKETLHAGMLGCTEFVWPIDDKILACEDGYYVTADGAIPFTI